MSSSKGKAVAPLKSALKKTGSKGTISVPASSSTVSQSKGKVTIGKPSKGKGKEQNLDDDEEDEFEGESNASGFSGGEDDDLEANDEFDLEGMDVDAEGKEAEGEDEDEDEDEVDTEDEIDAMYDSKKKSKLNTKKRKEATTEDIFGNTLAGLLDDDVTVSQPSKPAKIAATEEPSAKRQKPVKTLKPGANPILALSSRPLPPSSTAEALERKAKKAVKAEEKERQDRARVKNVIEGWGPTAEGAPGGQEWERGLRKVAQRGVIKLFNAILQASATHATDAATLALDDNNKRKSKKEKDNVLGRGGKEDRLTKEGFLDLIKSGGK